MGRKENRQALKKQKRTKYTLTDVQRASNVAIMIRKINKGHLFSKTMKDKCVFCGATQKTRTQCKYWFFTYLDRMQVALINPSYFTDENATILYMTHDSEYQDIVVPMFVSTNK